MKEVPYSSVVWSIMYAMVCTRPDVAYGVGLVSRFMGNPGKIHWNKAKWILRYLKGTSEFGILFGGDNGVTSKVIGYVDSTLLVIWIREGLLLVLFLHCVVEL